MKKVFFVLLPALMLFPCSRAGAIPMPQADSEKIPTQRLIANLEKRIAADPKKIENRYALARVHAIAYAQDPQQFAVEKRTGTPIFGAGGTADLPPPMTRKRADGTTNQHLQTAIRQYRAVVATDTNHLYAWLGLGWCLQEVGDHKGALNAYRPALELAWKAENKREFMLDDSVTEEIARHMLELLDPVRDAAEIARVKKYQKVMSTKGRVVSPILIPLSPAITFADLVAPDAGVAFDLDGSGLPRRWGWITTNAAWLVFDPDGSGRITSGLQLFGNVTFWVFWRDGYAALASLDDDGDGVLRGAELNGLALWHDANGNGRSEPGEVRPVTSWGLRALSTRCVPHPGGFPFSPHGAEFDDGTTRPTYDWIAPAQTPKPR